MKNTFLQLLERAGVTALVTFAGLLSTISLTSWSALDTGIATAIAAALSVIVNGVVALYGGWRLPGWADALVRVGLTYGQAFVALLAVHPAPWSFWRAAAGAALPTLLSAIKVLALTLSTGTPALPFAVPKARPGYLDEALLAHGAVTVNEVRQHLGIALETTNGTDVRPLPPPSVQLTVDTSSWAPAGPSRSVRYPRALGLRRPTRARPTLELGTYLTGVVPAHPISIDNTGHVGYGLDGNDKYGVCVPTGYDNYRRTTTTALTGTTVVATQADIWSWYRTQNPNFDPATDADDNGMEIQTFLEYLVKTGEILGFASVDPANAQEVDAALFLFLGVLYGVDLEVAQQQQTPGGVWDYSKSGEWGGHCVVGVGYEPVGQDIITWAERVRMTPEFVSHQAQQAFVLIRPEHVAHPDFRAGVNLAALAEDYRDLTGKTWPGAAPTPTPTPPAPPPGPVLPPEVTAVWPAIDAWAHARHEGKNRVAAENVLQLGSWLGLPTSP